MHIIVSYDHFSIQIKWNEKKRKDWIENDMKIFFCFVLLANVMYSCILHLSAFVYVIFDIVCWTFRIVCSFCFYFYNFLCIMLRCTDIDHRIGVCVCVIQRSKMITQLTSISRQFVDHFGLLNEMLNFSCSAPINLFQ